MPRLREPPSPDRRDDERDARLGSGAASRPAHPPPQVRLPRLASTIHQAPAPECPIAKGLATPGLIAQVLVSKYLRPHTALSPGPDPRPPWRPDRTLDTGGLGRRRLLVAGAAAGAACRPCLRVDQAVRRRHTSSGTRSWPWKNQDRTALQSMRATSAPGPGRNRRQPSTSTAPTARPNGRRLIWDGSAASCRSTAMPGSNG